MKKYKNFLFDGYGAKQEAGNLIKRSRFAVPMAIIGLMFIFTLVAVRAEGPSPFGFSLLRATNTIQDEVITPPPVPIDVQVPAGNVSFLVGHATGTQNYICLPCDPTKPNCPSGVAYTLFTPQATLFNEDNEQIITHFFSPNPFEFSPNPNEGGIIRATWQHSQDTSTVWGKVIGSSTDSRFVTPGAIPWLLVQVKDVGAQVGPTGGDKLTKTTFIQRLNTVGGAAPSTRCSGPAEIGNKAFVPYKSDYFFYKKANY